MAQTKKPKQLKHSTGSKKTTNSICKECSAICCSGLTVTITKPRTDEEIEELNWYLRMNTVSIFITNYRWHMLFEGKCMYLTRNNMCKIYDRRPKQCRKHDPSHCERNGDFYDTLITTPEELRQYLPGTS